MAQKRVGPSAKKSGSRRSSTGKRQTAAQAELQATVRAAAERAAKMVAAAAAQAVAPAVAQAAGRAGGPSRPDRSFVGTTSLDTVLNAFDTLMGQIQEFTPGDAGEEFKQEQALTILGSAKLRLMADCHLADDDDDEEPGPYFPFQFTLS